MRTWTILLSCVLSACVLDTANEGADEAHEIELGKAEQAMTARQIFEDPGRAYAVELRECWTFSRSPSGGLTRYWAMPSYVNQATVVLNGFQHNYNNGDHHLRFAGAQIKDVALIGSQLQFQLTGNLSDENGDDPVTLCWQAVALGWSTNAIDARTAFAFRTETVHVADGRGIYRTTLHGGCDFGQNAVAAVIPRGFLGGFDDGTDHHLYRFSHALSQDNEPGACISFDASGLIQDNKPVRRNFWQTWASLVVGTGVRVQTTPFSFGQVSTASNCIVPGTGWQVQHKVERNLPYDYAVPMLTGFTLGYPCDDEHVLEMGSRILNTTWNAATRTLEYDIASRVIDNDLYPGTIAYPNATILGLVRATNAETVLRFDAQLGVAL